MQYKSSLATHKDVFEIILFLWIISSVQAQYSQINVTRQSDGDILAFAYKVNCVSLNAQCLPKNKRETGRNICDNCKCLSRYTSYVSTEKQCINIHGIINLNCRTLQKQMPVLDKSTKVIGGPIQANRCKVKGQERNPLLHSGNADTSTWSWIRMMDVNFSLTSSSKANSRSKDWHVTFINTTISKMLTKYFGRVVMVKISCTTGDVCIIFKIAGSFVTNSTIVKHPYEPYSPDSTHPTTIETTILPDYTTESSVTASVTSGNNTVENQNIKSGKNNQTIWIIVITILIVIIIIIAMLFFICYKRKKTAQSNAEYPRRDIIVPHEYDVPIIPNLKHNEEHGNRKTEEHMYETFSETPYVIPPSQYSGNVYQELNHNNRDIDHLYQPLIKPAKSVPVTPDDQASDAKSVILNDDEYELMGQLK